MLICRTLQTYIHWANSILSHVTFLYCNPMLSYNLASINQDMTQEVVCHMLLTYILLPWCTIVCMSPIKTWRKMSCVKRYLPIFNSPVIEWRLPFTNQDMTQKVVCHTNRTYIILSVSHIACTSQNKTWRKLSFVAYHLPLLYYLIVP